MLDDIPNYEEEMLFFEENLDKKLSWLNNEFMTIRAGRANPRMLDKIVVDYYGTPTPIKQMANISVPEARMITISPWDMSMVKEIVKAIQASDLGVNPSDDGRMIRLVFPMPTEERRRELLKTTRKLTEDAKVGMRNARRDVLEVFKKQKNNKEISEDDMGLAEKEVQKLTDKYTEKADAMSQDKEKEIMEI